jgi:hypothetical protein
MPAVESETPAIEDATSLVIHGPGPFLLDPDVFGA